jgi:hypothetical protein
MTSEEEGCEDDWMLNVLGWFGVQLPSGGRMITSLLESCDGPAVTSETEEGTDWLAIFSEVEGSEDGCALAGSDRFCLLAGCLGVVEGSEDVRALAGLD